MGASQSTPDSDEKVFHSELPIQFSSDVVNHLSDHLASSETSPERQSTLDARIRARIHSELERLKEEEKEVQSEIEQALEKENLDRERSLAGDGEENEDSEYGRTPSSAALLGDLEEVKTKVDKYQARRDLTDLPDVKASQEALVSCYKSHETTPLECWREVESFRAAVGAVEQSYLKSLH